MISWRDVEQFIPFIKPLFDGLRSARDLLTGRNSKKSAHCISIPKQTLVLLPDIRSHALNWGLGKDGLNEGMQITGLLQATNTSPYAIRPAGIRLLEPKGVDIVTQSVVVFFERKIDSANNLIPAGQIGEIHFMLFVTPLAGVAGKSLRAAILILDQFGNEHVVRDLKFKFVGPEKLP